MEFTQQPYCPGETIAAVATPPGEGGVAIIRISGKDALAVAAKVFSGPVHTYQSHTVHYGKILNEAREPVDDVLLIPFLGSRSFTGEDTVEIHGHGGGILTRRVLDVVLRAGARAALPGEFSFRAFINGKIDLAQAEAIQELIGAKNERALDAAGAQLQGRLSARISAFQLQLTETAAVLEAWVDFPDEGLEFATMDELCVQLDEAKEAMQRLAETFHEGRIIHDGIALCLAGSPNVGKSSLMNALLDKDRAIVSHVAGTTRDVLEDHLRLNGLNFRLIDTAGIRESEEIVEQEGIRRTRDAMKSADLILLVLDAHRGLDGFERQLLAETDPKKTIVIWNKIDLEHPPLPELALPHLVTLSAKEKQGLEELHAMIDRVIWDKGPPSREEALITNIRHKESLEQAIHFCGLVVEGLRTGVSPEFVAMDMRSCLGALGKVIGTNVGEDILSAIFSKFCIGK